uniref:Myosin motor domain-containing protein n=1 Tax=Meloidogyne hapla TaxID=6305 RepID=A0A1I8BX98_MELHA
VYHAYWLDNSCVVFKEMDATSTTILEAALREIKIDNYFNELQDQNERNRIIKMHA